MLETATQLTELVTKAFTNAGVPLEHAEIVSDHLVASNLAGHDSHGVIRTTKYMQWLREQRVVANQHAQLVWESDVLAIVEGNMGYGQVIGAEAVQLGVDKCGNQGDRALGRNGGRGGADLTAFCQYQWFRCSRRTPRRNRKAIVGQSDGCRYSWPGC